MFRSVSFHNFKALENFSIALRKTNVLVGQVRATLQADAGHGP